MSIGKKVSFGILFMALLACAVGILGTLFGSQTAHEAASTAAASISLKAVTEARFRLQGQPGEARAAISELSSRLSGEQTQSLGPETLARVKALTQAAERAAATNDASEASTSLASAADVLTRQIESSQTDLAGEGGTLHYAGLLLTFGAAGLGLFLSFMLGRQTVGPLYRVIEGLKEGSRQTASAAAQVAAAAQGVAHGAADQAASLEETSAAIEELGAMIRQNASNAGEANRLVEKVEELMKQAREVMRQATKAMKGITTASQEAAKVVKTIDEIAFQTNLLALNAAVEAARAGEAGMGFAVVAGEVRNLAQRSAAAASNTTQLIHTNLTSIREGEDLVQRADEAYREVALASKQVARLVSEIATASQEQAQGVEQLNISVSQVDRVTQGNAATAEQAAAASEELTAQAAAIENVVSELRQVVGLDAEPAQADFRPPVPARPARGPAPRQAAPRSAPAASPLRRQSAEEVIPFDDGPFPEAPGGSEGPWTSN
jgi:methyl-accepting chemotaxis protein